MTASRSTESTSESILLHEATYRVRFDEAGPDGPLRTSGLLALRPGRGLAPLDALGFDRDWYAERELTWLVRAAELAILAPSRWARR